MELKLVGTQIANLRKQKGLTQNDLGERLLHFFFAVITHFLENYH